MVMVMKKLMVIFCMPLMTAMLVKGQDREQQPAEPNKADTRMQSETNEYGNTMKCDSANAWSWSSDGDLPEEFKEQIKKFNESFKSMHKHFDFEFSFPEDFANRFNRQFEFRMDSAFDDQVNGLLFDFDGNAAYLEKFEQSMKEFFEDEGNLKLWKDLQGEHMKKLEQLLDELDFEQFTPHMERKGVITL